MENAKEVMHFQRLGVLLYPLIEECAKIGMNSYGSVSSSELLFCLNSWIHGTRYDECVEGEVLKVFQLEHVVDWGNGVLKVVDGDCKIESSIDNKEIQCNISGKVRIRQSDEFDDEEEDVLLFLDASDVSVGKSGSTTEGNGQLLDIQRNFSISKDTDAFSSQLQQIVSFQQEHGIIRDVPPEWVNSMHGSINTEENMPVEVAQNLIDTLYQADIAENTNITLPTEDSTIVVNNNISKTTRFFEEHEHDDVEGTHIDSLPVLEDMIEEFIPCSEDVEWGASYSNPNTIARLELGQDEASDTEETILDIDVSTLDAQFLED